MSKNATFDIIEWSKLNDPKQNFIEDDSIVIEFELKITNVKGLTTEKPESIELNKKPILSLECSICMESLFDRSISSTPRGHIFCTPCIERSFHQKEVCPTCI